MPKLHQYLCTAVAPFVLVHAVSAKPATSTQPLPEVKATTVAKPGEKPAYPMLPYDKLKKSLRVDPAISLEVVRADPATHTGRVIEIKGTVNGVMATQSGRTVVMESGNASMTFVLQPDARDIEVLQAGAAVRALMMVGQTADKTGVTLTLMAATDKPDYTPVFKAIEEDEKLLNAPVAQEPTVISLDNLQPYSENSLPKPPPARPPAIQASKPGIPPNQEFTPPTDPIESQKPFYKAIIRQHNKKLREAQVEEIAVALLRAGYAHNMDPRFLAAIIAVESDFDIYCTSSSGAMGLGQLMPFNLKEARVSNPWNPTQNIFGTARLLRGHLNDYSKRADGTLLAVAAYNAGPGAVRRAGYKVPKGAQVQRYVWKVYHRYKRFAPDMFK